MQDNPFSQAFGHSFFNSDNTKTTEKIAQEKNKLLLPYISHIRGLEAQVIILANNCATLSSKVHEQNSDYWIELTAMQVKRR